jgi:hypothetical protein
MGTKKWKIDKSGKTIFIDDTITDWQVCKIGIDCEENEANAKLIVTSVNNFKPLVEALNKILKVKNEDYGISEKTRYLREIMEMKQIALDIFKNYPEIDKIEKENIL